MTKKPGDSVIGATINGSGTDIAIESADITLIQGDLTAVIKAVKLSRATFRKIRQNPFWAYFYNAVAIPVAILGKLHPLIAEGAMALSSVNVVTNSARLRHVSIRPSPQVLKESGWRRSTNLYRYLKRV